MEIVKIQPIVSSNDKVKLKIVGELNQWEETITILKQDQDRKISSIEATQIRTYLKRYIKSRIKAYTITTGQHSNRVIALRNFAHYLDTYYPAGHAKGFFTWIYGRKDLLQDTLPVTENIATLKIRVILEKCHQYTV